MLDNLKIRWALICLVFFSSVYFIFPTFEYYIFNTNSNLDNTIKLGLDLKGGLNIVLEIDEYDIEALSLKLRIYQFLKEDDKVIDCCKKILKIDYENYEVKDILDQLEET